MLASIFEKLPHTFGREGIPYTVFSTVLVGRRQQPPPSVLRYPVCLLDELVIFKILRFYMGAQIAENGPVLHEYTGHVFRGGRKLSL